MNELNDELESLQSRMEQLTAAIDEARVQNVHRDQEQAETLEKITKQLEEQTALADVAEEDFAKVRLETRPTIILHLKQKSQKRWHKTSL